MEEERLRESLEGRGESNREEGESGKAGGGWVRGCSSTRNLYKRDVCVDWGPGWGWSEGLPARGAPVREAASEEALGWQHLVKQST